ncbi:MULTISPECIES: hypothetical protein [Halomonadaceae]|uniref:hypothetical protein n=1 Tax=Halomonadaceae TaxID=28256 RepID=UPI003F8D99BB
MSFKVTLNSVDEHIKGMMLSCPGLFPNRLAALKHLFMVNGNGYAWNENGELVGGNDQPPCGAMDYTDLYERQEKLARDVATTRDPLFAQLNATRQAAMRRDLSVRKLVEQDIDLYASEHVMGEELQRGVDWLAHFNPRACVMQDAPYGHLHPEWAAAAEEVFEIARSAIRCHLGMYSPHFNRDNASHYWLQIDHQLMEILDKLDQTTGTKAHRARQTEIAKQVIDNLLAESAS